MEVKSTHHSLFIRFGVDSSSEIEMSYSKKLGKNSIALKLTVVQTSPYCVPASSHTKEPIKKAYADKGYHRYPHREFLSSMNGNVLLFASPSALLRLASRIKVSQPDEGDA